MKHEVKDLTIDRVHAFDNELYNGIRIEWSANIGWGQCDIFREKADETSKWQAHTETMSTNEDKVFLKMLLDKLADMVVVTG